MCQLIQEVCNDIDPETNDINIGIMKSGQILLFTTGNRIDLTLFTDDGQIYYTSDWDRILGRIRKEKNDDTVRTDNGV